ncbi:unnamed protein product [Rhodiola kirilowii]
MFVRLRAQCVCGIVCVDDELVFFFKNCRFWSCGWTHASFMGISGCGATDTQTMNSIVITSVELIYCYAECLAMHERGVRARLLLLQFQCLKKLLLSSNEAIQTSISLAMSSRLLQVPFPKQTLLTADDVENITIPSYLLILQSNFPDDDRR